MKTTRIFIIVIVGCLYLVGQVFGQSGSLALTSAAGSPGGHASLALSLNASGGSQPAAIQWQLSYRSSDIASITATIGPAAIAGGKSLSCSRSGGSYTCLLSGLNSNAIGNGVIANIGVTLSTTITTSTSISVINTIGASPTGSVIPLTATGGTITVAGTLPGLQSLTCNPVTIVTPAASTCTVSLTRKVSSNIPIALQDNSRHLALPGAVLISPGSSSTSFTVGGGAVTATEVVVVAATLGGSSKTVHLVLRPSQTVSSQATVSANNSGAVQPANGAGVKLDALSCLPKAVAAGDSITCQVHFGSMSDATILSVASNGDLQVPASLATRAKQSTLRFQGYSSPSAPQQSVVLQVASGVSMVQDTVTIVPSASPVLTVPQKQLVKKTTALTFTVSAANPSGGAVALSAWNLPSGASFDPRNGLFHWTPSERQSGSYDVGFTAENAIHLSATAHVLIEVGSGKPVVTSLVNGASRSPDSACSPGAMASVLGKWLVPGNSTVHVNGDAVQLLHASETSLDFICPQLPPGTPIQVSIEDNSGNTAEISSVMQAATPGIATADGSGQGQGLILFLGSTAMAIARNPLVWGQPAQPGDSVALRVTGVSLNAGLSVKLGNVIARAQSVQVVNNSPGMSDVLLTVPPGAPAGDAVPVSIQLALPSGEIVESNVVTMAIEE